MKKCTICGKEIQGPSLSDLLREVTPDAPVQCSECMEIIAEICDERKRKGQPIPAGFAEARAAVIEYKKNNAMFWFKKANKLDYLKRFDEAVTYYQRGLAIRPDYVDALNNLGLNLCELGRPADGLPYLDQAISLAPDDPYPWINKALCLERLGRRKEAARCRKKAASLKGH